ncbi:hypothetical protein B0H14DRAFT_2631327 [Mycena olivaceomarginata]|nr:hypothetical protein B0H14DRAFT_2631327 [Mycena olivaceomarginata]
MRELVAANPQCVLPLNEVVRLHMYFTPIPSQPQRPRSSTKLVTAPGAVPAALQLEVLKKLRLVQLISRGANAERLHTLLDNEKQTFSSDRNLGLVTQDIDHAPRWKLKKPMATYVTLGLSDIARVVGIQSEDEVRALGLSMLQWVIINIASVGAQSARHDLRSVKGYQRTAKRKRKKEHQLGAL